LVGGKPRRYQNSDFAFAAGKLDSAIASKCCRRNPNPLSDWHLAVLGVLLVRSMWAIASGRSFLKFDGFSPQQGELGSEFDIG
jgi:hypothetical protein